MAVPVMGELPVQHEISRDTAAPRQSSSEENYVSSLASLPPTFKHQGFRAGIGLHNVARRTLGILLLLVTVFLWTSSNFLASVSGLITYTMVFC